MKYKIAATALTYIAIIGMLMFITTPIATTEVEYNYYWVNDLSDTQIFVDGYLNDWASIASYSYLGVNYSIGYDDSNIYVAAFWADTAENDQISMWNKSGMIDSDDALWQFIDGEDDRLAVGFTNGIDSDIWVWTASNRTHNSYAYEMNITGNPDSGNLPFVMNSNTTSLDGNNTKPIYNSTYQQITDYSAIPNGTMINAWFPQTPTGSQTDVSVDHDFDGINHKVEFKRAIDTGNEDDFIWNLKDLTNMYFLLSVSPPGGDDARDMDFYMTPVEQTREWYDITATTNVYLLGDAKIFTTGNNNGTTLGGETHIDSVTWRLLEEPLAFPTIVTFLIIIGLLAAVLAGIFFIAGKKIGMIIAAAAIGLVAGVVMLIGGIMYQSWTVWFTDHIFPAFEEIEFLDDLQYGSITLTDSGLGLGFYTPIIFGGIIAAIAATMLGLNLYEIFSKKKIKQKE